MKIVYEKLPMRFKAYFRMCPDGFFTIAINERLSWTKQRKAYIHELEHINENDLFSHMSASEIEQIRHSFPNELEPYNVKYEEEMLPIIGANTKTEEEIEYERQQEWENVMSGIKLKYKGVKGANSGFC